MLATWDTPAWTYEEESQEALLPWEFPADLPIGDLRFWQGDRAQIAIGRMEVRRNGDLRGFVFRPFGGARAFGFLRDPDGKALCFLVDEAGNVWVGDDLTFDLPADTATFRLTSITMTLSNGGTVVLERTFTRPPDTPSPGTTAPTP